MINTPARESHTVACFATKEEQRQLGFHEEDESVQSSSKMSDGTESTDCPTDYSDSSRGREGSFLSRASSSSLPTICDGGSEAFAAAKAASQRLFPRRSILKQSWAMEDIHIDNTRRSWLQLPPADMDKVRDSLHTRHSVSLPVCDADFEKVHDRTCKKSVQVSFRDVSIRAFDQCISDNPSVSYGPPIGLDWKYEELEPVPIDDYEEVRGPQRARKNMALSYYHRVRILEHLFGHSKEELKKAHKEADREKLKRAVTKAFLPAQKVEEVFQSAGRKTKRYLQNGRRKSSII